MNHQYIRLVTFLQILSLGLSYTTPKYSGPLLGGIKTVATAALEGAGLGIQTISPLLDGLFDHCVEPPLECPNENVTFWYYSSSDQDEGIELSVEDESSFMNLTKNDYPWKILIHGYTKSKNEIPNPELRSAYFQRGNYNILSVDYSLLAQDKCYLQAAHNVPLVANCTAQIIDTLVEKNLLKLKDLHIIGYSLGAQVAGQIKQNLKNGTPSRVTGLDPASPLFDGVINTQINSSAGDFVDILHTNGLFKGKLESLGHVDFYVNGGLSQPGCLLDNNGSVSTCSHDRSPKYFAESINSEKGFWGVPCPNYALFLLGSCKANENDLVLLGEDISHSARGNYYLQTNSKFPFALGKKTSPNLMNFLSGITLK